MVESSHEYLVVLNDEEQYSIWRSDRALPAGWYAEGTRGSKDACRDHVDRIWTDVRPLSVRKQLNQTSGFVPAHRKVADRGREVPDRTAVTDQWTSISYGRLVARAEELAAVLVRRGVRRGDAVAVHLQRGVALVVTLMAVSQAGGTALMLDLAGPEQWLEGFVDRARPVAWITHEESPEPAFDGTVCRVDVEGRFVGEAGTGAVDFPEIGPEDAACLVQTSGSTGEPKLALVPHRTWAFACESQQSAHGIDEDERGAWLCPSHSCVSVSTVIWPFLAAGAHISVPSQDTSAVPAELAAWIRAERVTQFFAVAPLAEALARLEWPPSALRLLLTGSDRVREWGRPDLPFEIANWYGAVEVNIVTSSMLPREKRITSATASAADRAGTPPIGRVWPGVTWRVVDADDQPVAPGEVG
ncbi:MAG TPA: AMP-binding protein, partial [Lentzea sp.]